METNALLSNFGEIAGLPITIQELATCHERKNFSTISNITSPWLYSNETISNHPKENLFPEGYDETSFELEENIGEARFLGGGGCNDAFSVFAFLTFVLSLLDIIMQLQNGGRRRRSESDNFSLNFDHRDAVIASHSLVRGFTNAITVDLANKNSCIEKFLCEGWLEASRRGDSGKSFAKMSISSAQNWLLQARNPALSKDYQKAMNMGIILAEGEGDLRGLSRCSKAYPDCRSVPSGYRFPGVGDPQSKLVPDAFREHKIEAYRIMSHFVNLADKNFDFENLRLDMN